jgi:pyruvate/2-oxoglutarate dehydrogenase complex dihydrolipoamide acyltransferase (E2) component
MSIEILMPALSPTMEEGTLAKWLVKEGDSVSSGDLIAEIETDKATMEVEAVDDGKIGELLVDEGTEGVKVNTPIATLLDSNELPHTTIKKIADKPYLEKQNIINKSSVVLNIKNNEVSSYCPHVPRSYVRDLCRPDRIPPSSQTRQEAPQPPISRSSRRG